MATTFERVQEVAKEIYSEPITEATTLRSFHFDALDLVQLIEDLEKEFEIQIDDEYGEKFQTFGEIVRYIDRQLGDKQ